MIIDFHTHVWPEKVAEKAREHLESLFKVTFVGSPILDTLLTFMDENGIDISIVCGVATKPEQVPSINNWLFGIRNDKIKAFCTLHPDYPECVAELKRIKQNADGVKFQPEFQNFYVDEERVFPIYAQAEKLGIPILFHCGEELSGTMLVRSSPERILRVKENFPSLKIIAAHFGGFKLWDAVEKFLLGKDIYLDTSYFLHYLPTNKVKQLILNHEPDRLLFGTDFPLIDQKKDIDALRALRLPAILEEKIFSLNAIELLGLAKN